MTKSLKEYTIELLDWLEEAVFKFQEYPSKENQYLVLDIMYHLRSAVQKCVGEKPD